MSNETNTNTTTEADKLQKIEQSLIDRYGDKIVKGSVRRAPKDSEYGTKVLVDIRTVGLDGQFDGNTRTVATSDVWQVHHTEEVTRELRKQRAAEKRAAKKPQDQKAKKPQSAKKPQDQKAKKPQDQKTKKPRTRKTVAKA